MANIKLFNRFIKENVSKNLTLYHGTCDANGKFIIENGWVSRNSGYGSNMGNPNYLYLSSEPEDALWFAQEKGCNMIIEVMDIPIEYLRPDPEDEAGFTMKDLYDRMNTNGMPSKFILTKPLDKSHFRQYNL